jgi:hypothetical protein
VVAGAVARIAVAASVAAGAGLVMVGLARVAMPHVLPTLRAAVELTAGSVLGGAVLLIALHALRVSEFQLVLTRVTGLLRR